jgi:tetratricopeptide (TPR) repeat protein
MAYRHDDWDEAAKAYHQAVRLDPNFALAWAHLSRAHSAPYEDVQTVAHARVAREAAERAVELAPERAEGYEARAQYYTVVEGDFARGLLEIERAEQLAPRDVDVLNRKARLVRNLGRWEESLRVSQEAKQLDPASISTAKDLTETLTDLRRYPEALAEADRALALDPTDLYAVHLRVSVSLGQGDLVGARAVLRKASKEIEPASLVRLMADTPWVLDETQQRLLRTLGRDRLNTGPTYVGPIQLVTAYALRGDLASVRENAELARAELETRLRAVPPGGAVFGLHSGHALALAYLGRKAEAIAEGEQAAAQRPLTKDALWGPIIQEHLARVYLLVGEQEKALDRLEPLLKVPFELSPGWLRIDPTFAQLRGNPRFEKLLKGSN